MALPDYAGVQSGTTLTWKSSGGDHAITLASLANGSARQGAKGDFGAVRAPLWDVYLDIEMAATPTAGLTIDVYLSPSSSAVAATDNAAGCSGADAAYSGYSSNLDASLKQAEYLGSHNCTTDVTTTVQTSKIGRVAIPQRYGSPIVDNNSGAAVHSSDTNCQLRFVPVEDLMQDAEI